MSKKDIHTIDNTLIRVSIIWIFCLTFYGSCVSTGMDHAMLSCAEPGQRLFVVTQGTLTTTFTRDLTLSEVQAEYPDGKIEVYTSETLPPVFDDVHLLYLLTPWVLLLIGIKIRREENKVIDVWNVLERFDEIKLSELSKNTGYNEDFVLRAVHIINEHSEQSYHWDKRNRIIHTPSTDEELFYIPKCNNCGASIQKTMRLSKIKAATCPYCQFAFITETMVDQANASAADAARAADLEAQAPLEKPEDRFSGIIFSILITVMPPLGIAYAVYKSRLVKRL